jgi:type IV pilus assembly protein PilY1
MKLTRKYIAIVQPVVFLMVSICLGPALGADCNCYQDTAEPPFLATGAAPNLLLMIDNSASMYDSIYTDPAESNGIDDDGDGTIDEDGEATMCYDDTYDPDTTYVGYFEKDQWYAYNLALESNGIDDDGDGDIDEGEEATRFELSDDGDCEEDATWSAYSNDYVCMAVTVTNETDDEGTTYDVYNAESFRAKGNFLNWASSSRFDVEKKILTGGKYDAGTGLLESEGRGCSGSRYIRQVAVQNEAGTDYKLVLGVRTDDELYDGIDTTLIDIYPPSSAGFDPSSCQDAIDLMMGDPSGFGSVKNAIVECMEYEDIYEYHRQDGEHDKQALVHSLHDCWYLDKQGSWPSSGAQGFNFDKWCEEIYERVDPREITSDDPAYICSGDSTDADDEGGYIGECYTPAGACGEIACSVDPGVEGQRCEGGYVEVCANWVETTYFTDGSVKKDGYCKKDEDWEVYIECTSGAATGSWAYTDADELDACIEAARARFCGVLQTSEVVDPSDLETTTGETWNLPAMLMGQGASGQLGVPMYTFQGVLEAGSTPSGLLHEFAGELRIGAMAFNYDGSDSECYMPEPHIRYDCDDPYNRDGAEVIQPIGSDAETSGHTEALITNINEVKANSWTPLAEAMHTAIGYYSQVPGLELNAGLDFSTYDAPITEYCQSNNVLFITDGSSTADLNADMIALAQQVTTMSLSESDGDVSSGCGDLYGSSYFDDLAFYARQGDIYSGSTYTFTEDPENISTWIVFTGDTADTGDECAAYTLMQNAVANGGPNAVTGFGSDEVLLGEDPDELYSALRSAFESVLKRASAGSAASVISATRSGEGGVYQAIFWPAKDGPVIDGVQEEDVTWIGEVHALLMDDEGLLYEDTDGDKALDKKADSRVVLYFDDDSDTTKACYGEIGDDGFCTGTVKDINEVQYLWSAAEWLSGVSDADIGDNRSPYISSDQQRYIFTWNDLDSDGAVDDAEVFDFESPFSNWSDTVSGSRVDTVYQDFGADSESEVDTIIEWVRGKDVTGYRTREIEKPDNFNVSASADNTVTWRLGDVIHSTPTLVSSPSENYHLMYRDTSYSTFVRRYQKRRHMIYFGANDGMIHAVNGGFYNEDSNQFNTTSDGSAGSDAPALGAEMWAYIPYNLQPQIKCLMDSDYQHKYYVDLKPRIFDVQIFSDDTDHPNGWGTILVAGMGFGGGSVDAEGDDRKFVSSYVIMDITNPEVSPVLLGELTYDAGVDAHMGYTTLVPAVAPMKSGTTTKWYLILGTGPLVLEDTDGDGQLDWVYNEALGGVSNQPAQVAVFPLDKLTDGDGVFRIPDTTPTEDTAGVYNLLDTSGAQITGFVSDPISVDFDQVSNYRADAVYFGTVEGDWGGWRGRLYRLVTGADTDMTDPADWGLYEMLNPERPITAAPMVGWDGDNYWVYFGSGRFLHADDKTDASSNAQERFYGLKEPADCTAGFTWGTLALTDLVDVSDILVSESTEPSSALLSCDSGSTACIAAVPDSDGDGDVSFLDLDVYIAGEGCVSDVNTGGVGWVHSFDLDGERNVGQSTLLGGLITFTTYQPFEDLCQMEGLSYLYALYYRTGTAWHEAVFDTGGSSPVQFKADLGKGLATTPNLHVGGEDGAKVFAQTSTGAIVEVEQPNLPDKGAKTGRLFWQAK